MANVIKVKDLGIKKLPLPSLKCESLKVGDKEE